MSAAASHGVASGACRSDVRRYVNSGSPTGAVSGHPDVRAVFDHPMVQRDAVGKPAVAPLPVRIRPEQAGAFTWVDARTLSWSPEGALPRATGFTVEVPAGTLALDGARLDEPQRFTFETPRPVARASRLPGSDGTEDDRWAPREPPLLVEVSQPVAVAEIGRACRFSAAHATVAAAATVAGDEGP